MTRITASGQGTPEWQGWLVLGTLIVGFAAVAWWLFFSPLPTAAGRSDRGRHSLRARRLLAGLILLSGMLFVLGARWDELWHRLDGGFGNDFLWPPHLMMYASLGLVAAVAAGLVGRDIGAWLARLGQPESRHVARLELVSAPGLLH